MKPITRRQELKATKGCEYCNEWKAYGSEEDNAMLDKIGVPPGSGWNAKECHRLLKLLYLDEISIEEFKEMFTDAGMDYNQVEHCCGCAGCYESKTKTHTCPDFDIEDLDRPDCKIRDPIYFCDICGKPAKYGDITRWDEDIINRIGTKGRKRECYDWLCEKHYKMREKQLELEEVSENDVLAKHIGI